MTAGNEEQLVSNVFHRKTPVDKKAKDRKVESSQLSLVSSHLSSQPLTHFRVSITGQQEVYTLDGSPVYLRTSLSK